MTALLEISGISVRYGRVEAVRDVSLSFAPGSIATVIGGVSACPADAPAPPCSSWAPPVLLHAAKPVTATATSAARVPILGRPNTPERPIAFSVLCVLLLLARAS